MGATLAGAGFGFNCRDSHVGLAPPARFRDEQLRRQLPDAFDAMGRALQAGQSVPAALQIVANEGRQPLAREFARACEQHNLGISFEQSLQDLSLKVPVIELRILAIALMPAMPTPLQAQDNSASTAGTSSTLSSSRTCTSSTRLARG